MKNNQVLFLVTFLVVIGSVIYSMTGDSKPDQNYTGKLLQQRAEKDEYMRNDEHSPLNDLDKAGFSGLNYFSIDETYKVKAQLTHFNKIEIVTMPTSDGKEKKYEKYAYAHFKLNNKDHQLLLYKPVTPSTDLIFLPFADETSADETYGGGRYLDFSIPEGNELEIDFNLAYNPYCAYNSKYSCPIPPKENFLLTPIIAGEKDYVRKKPHE